MRITKGIIAAAGKGTRFLPVTRAIPKEMLPVVDKPIIQYIVEEFVSAGIKDIVIVTSSDYSVIENHFGHNTELEDHLRKSGKKQALQEMRRIADMANFIYIRQRGPYGNGTPCLNAAKIIGPEPFVYAFGDDLALSRSSFTKQMIEAYKKNPGIYLGAQDVQKDQVHKYGIISPKKGSKGGKGSTGEIKGVVEKPEAKNAPSNLANIGRFILPPEIFPVLAKKRLGKGGELWLIDAIHRLINTGKKAYYKRIERGRWYTTGDPISYLEAVRAFAQARPEFKNKLKHIFK
ncbi:MAG: UTP--glucose-1-phosphate uridylyltransferase [Candidatus Doudnabacteria bacterium RIFCSPHIGHO2_01_FULL_46_14]|uniref:UTP--glucose-1-phosphate uridylyltransferase n=1 Tax=Candidatus Doudnabacteria bacterium RIFCSPHIGHO2_01_FULL_46_14 TaxID=1817824 RepID=A0A1F5NJ87_9BACT|nr:MAG: UTP--glucose-1-phosphate uridylyltransferase [Candidatus Doudnabacteria bacterium RIFCSPHIGHO2_01_FULL_46_14]